MNKKIQNAVLAILSCVPVLTSSATCFQQKVVEVRITDAKLAPINMGLDSTAHWLEKMKAGDANRGAALLSNLEKLAVRFNRLPKSDSEQYQFIVKRFVSLTYAIQEKSGKVASVSNASSNASETQSKTTGSKPHKNLFTINKQLDGIEKTLLAIQGNDSQKIETARKQLDYANDLMAAVPVSKHPDYQSTKVRLAEIAKRINGEVPAMEAEFDPKRLISDMRKKYSKDQLPRAQRVMSTRELTHEDAEYFIGKIASFRANVEKDLPRIKVAAQATGTASDLVSWVEKEADAYVDEQIEKLKVRIDRYIDLAMKDAANLASLDPVKNKYTFVTESVRRANEEKFARTLRTLEQVKTFEEALGLPARWSSRKADFEQHIAAYQEKAGQASTVKALPKDVGDDALSEIATITLAVEKYGAGEIERLIVNSKKIPRDRITTRYFNNALETTVRKWEEFQVCTVEKEDGKFIVYLNTLKKFSRGPATTPIDQWILAHRYKSGEISAEDLK